ncbi:hypothetical protein DUI87_12020 [Hirundo rustica rustica]|uniref:Peptidase A2 domain-containing protein n=1 Tax=Hirundo rustica rustica TaxID=333673 RepID=A0A3M0KD25_HIRRU|nr:hypothetical protein DUI87_12020 [Hirundo rustica rustica]
MDVAAAVDVTIMTTNPLKIPTRLIGPIIINGQPIKKGQRLAQLIPFPQLAKDISPMRHDARNQKSFGSTGRLTLLTINLSTRPRRAVELCLNGQIKKLMGLLDTGADTSIIAPSEWPHDWPLQAAATTVTRVGEMTLASRTPTLTVVIDGKYAQASFSITPLPPTVQCLIRQDVLAQLSIVLTNDHPLE